MTSANVVKCPKKKAAIPQAVADMPNRSIISLTVQPRTSLNLSKYSTQNRKYAPLLTNMNTTCVRNAERNSMAACRFAFQSASRKEKCFKLAAVHRQHLFTATIGKRKDKDQNPHPNQLPCQHLPEQFKIRLYKEAGGRIHHVREG